MTEYFGGEYELKRANGTIAQIEARHFFLKTLYQCRKDVVDDFSRLANIDSLPSWYGDDPACDEALNLILVGHLTDYAYYSQNLKKIGACENLRTSPVLTFVKYLFENTDEYARLRRAAKRKYQKLRTSRYFLQMVEEEILIRQFPNWIELQRKEAALLLCNSLKAWADRWNLTDDWILDFAIDLLRKFKIKALNSWQKCAKDPAIDDQIIVEAYGTWLFSGGSWQEALSDLYLNASNKQFRIAESLELPPFHFKYGGIDISTSWLSNWDRKTWFKTTITREFEKQISDQQSRGKIIPVGTKSRFASKLKSYIEQVDLIDNKNFYKLSRTKIVENHFLALIEYHVPPCQSYRKLAKKYAVDLKTIRRDLMATAALIGLTPRKPSPAGRPTGARTKFRRGLSIN